MVSQRVLKVGIVGASPHYGWAQRAQIPALRSLSVYELAAVCTSKLETAKESAKYFGVAKAYHDYRDLVCDPKIDVVSVCVRAPLHHKVVLAALKAGKNVYCEWPLASNSTQAEEMAAVAQSAGVQHMVGLQGRCDPAVLRLRRLINEENFVGEVLGCHMSLYVAGTIHLRTSNVWEAERSNGAHALSIGGGHTLDILTYCLGEFSELSAHVSTQLKYRQVKETGQQVPVSSPDHILLEARLKNGAAASAAIAYIPWHGTGWKLEVYGSHGTLVASSNTYPQLSKVIIKGGQRDDANLRELPIPEYDSSSHANIEALAVARMFGRLHKGIVEGDKVSPSFQGGLKLHRLLDSIQRSSDEGRRVVFS